MDKAALPVPCNGWFQSCATGEQEEPQRNLGAQWPSGLWLLMEFAWGEMWFHWAWALGSRSLPSGFLVLRWEPGWGAPTPRSPTTTLVLPILNQRQRARAVGWRGGGCPFPASWARRCPPPPMADLRPSILQDWGLPNVCELCAWPVFFFCCEMIDGFSAGPQRRPHSWGCWLRDGSGHFPSASCLLSSVLSAFAGVTSRVLVTHWLFPSVVEIQEVKLRPRSHIHHRFNSELSHLTSSPETNSKGPAKFPFFK